MLGLQFNYLYTSILHRVMGNVVVALLKIKQLLSIL